MFNRPLAQKLGIKPGFRLYLKNQPPGYLELLNPLPENVSVLRRLSTDIDAIHFFSKNRRELERQLTILSRRIKLNGMIWVSWPKKASRVKTDIAEDTIRQIALPLGLGDIKVCAVDEAWSGLKLVIRKALRNPS